MRTVGNEGKIRYNKVLPKTYWKSYIGSVSVNFSDIRRGSNNTDLVSKCGDCIYLSTRKMFSFYNKRAAGSDTT